MSTLQDGVRKSCGCVICKNSQTRKSAFYWTNIDMRIAHGVWVDATKGESYGILTLSTELYEAS